MDEPTVGLDPLLQNEIYQILLELRDQGTTIFISSHNLPEVERLCDRIAIIKNGKLVAVEDIKTLGEKKIHKIEVRFGDKFKADEFKLDGVDKIDEISGGLLITVGGDLNPILRAIAKHKVLEFEITHASLEDVFMKFYEGGNN
jgi:ABC-2 type transport system ATP-binding protein